jgi:hypothetical protein
MLNEQAKMWGTPTARDDQKSPEASARSLDRHTAGLRAVTTRTDGDSGSPKVDLNPSFVAALMGLPWDWLMPSTSAGTGSSLSAPLPPSAPSPLGLVDP